MRFVLRTLGIWLLLLAMVAAVVDATKSLAGGGAWAMTPLGEQWRQLFPEMLDGFRQWVINTVGDWLWDPILLSILAAPTWVVFGILGVFLYWLGQKRKEVEVYIN
jgi:hypothetical protein